MNAWRHSDARRATPQLRFLSRDAVAVLFGAAGDGKAVSPDHQDFTIPAHPGTTRSPRFVPRGLPTPPKVLGAEQGTGAGPVLVDVRRHDERTLYGSIPGSVHLPGMLVLVLYPTDTWRMPPLQWSSLQARWSYPQKYLLLGMAFPSLLPMRLWCCMAARAIGAAGRRCWVRTLGCGGATCTRRAPTGGVRRPTSRCMRRLMSRSHHRSLSKWRRRPSTRLQGVWRSRACDSTRVVFDGIPNQFLKHLWCQIITHPYCVSCEIE